jgi:hypothetical protein
MNQLALTKSGNTILEVNFNFLTFIGNCFRIILRKHYKDI